MQRSLSELLFPEYRRRVLELLLKHPDEGLHGREIARRTGLAAGTLNRELALLARSGVLRREERGNQHLYSLDAGCLIYEELASILQKTSGAERGRKAEPVLRETRAAYRARAHRLAVPKRKLEALCRKYRIRKLSVFGSAARGEAGPDSDVDLMVEFEPESAPSLWDFPEMQKAFSALFGRRRVDLVPPEALANPYRRKSILRDLKVLYGG
ncbi:MAG TPA: nucleotidyltransferase domain-containing protein [Burkholderiales bacterium]|nr:nucleotidyltransferase domain-containing protein [Burkholderiales bacterium]